MKVMISVGDGSGAAISKMVSNEKSRDKFVASVLDICDAFDFDGVDIDWEYPYFRTGSKEDKRNFILLLKVFLVFIEFNILLKIDFLRK